MFASHTKTILMDNQLIEFANLLIEIDKHSQCSGLWRTVPFNLKVEVQC